MFPIGSTLPHDTATFREGLAHGLAPLGLGKDAVSLEGDFPQLTHLRVNLTGANFHRGLAVSKAGPGTQPVCFARSVEITGHPVRVENVPASLDLKATDVVLAAADAAEGTGKVLILERANDGTLDLAVKKTDLESALFAAGNAAAQAKGAEVKSVELSLQNESPRALAIRAVITAKAMFFTTTVTVSGSVDVDAQLNARLRNLHCEGDGMIGKMAAGVLRPQFEQLEARSFPLGQAVAGLTLRDVTLSGGEELKIHAVFGAAA